MRQLDVLLTWRGKLGLFKPGGTGGREWLFLSAPQAPAELESDDQLLQCIDLVYRGAGLTIRDHVSIESGPVVEVSQCSRRIVHTVYLVETRQRRLELGSEYATYRWVQRSKIPRFAGRADWLQPVLEATAPRAAQLDLTC